jgi:hypothetical protein
MNRLAGSFCRQESTKSRKAELHLSPWRVGEGRRALAFICKRMFMSEKGAWPVASSNADHDETE